MSEKFEETGAFGKELSVQKTVGISGRFDSKPVVRLRAKSAGFKRNGHKNSGIGLPCDGQLWGICSKPAGLSSNHIDFLLQYGRKMLSEPTGFGTRAMPAPQLIHACSF